MRADLEFGEDVGVEEVADAERDDRANGDAPAAAEAEHERGLQLRAEGLARAHGHGEHDPRHEGRENHRPEASPDHAPREGVAIDLGEDVAEEIRERKENITCPEIGRPQEGEIHLDHLRRPDQVRAEQDRDKSPEDEVVVAEAALHGN